MSSKQLMRTSPRSGSSAPAPGGHGKPGWRDVVLVGVLAAAAICEAAIRPDLTWPVATAAVTVALVAGLPWRRSHPLIVVVVTTVIAGGFTLVQTAAGVAPNGLVTMFGLLMVPYALFRWGSRRCRVTGGVVLAAGVLLSVVLGGEGIPGAVAGVAFVGGACLIGAFRRERVAARVREMDIVRSREREALARDLHDTVAHHVSAIAIRAQVAGAVVHDAAQVSESLGVIEREAQAVLTEMRSLVRALRTTAHYDPSAGLAELTGLAAAGPPPVSVRMDAPEDMPDIVATTLFRIAQEAVTNARRHARAATAIEVVVTADADAVHIVVHDDGAPTRTMSSDGQGLRGMSERAALLGGSLEAGPDPAGGWTLRSTLPVRGQA